MKIPTNKYKDKQAKITEALLYAEFKRQRKKLAKLLASWDTKSFEEDLEEFLKWFAIQITDIITKKAKQVIKAGVKTGKRVSNLASDFEINWNLRNDEAVRYIQKLKDLHLNYFPGSIKLTTKKRILKLLEKGIVEGLSYTEIGKQIEKLDPFLFGKTRAELIAVQEIGRAYELGNYLPVKHIYDKGEKVEKRWITAGDERVRPTHRQNGKDGWIDLKLPFSGTGSLIAPCCFRCRCSTGYRIL